MTARPGKSASADAAAEDVYLPKGRDPLKGTEPGFAAPGVLKAKQDANVPASVQEPAQWLSEIATKRPEIGRSASDLRKRLIGAAERSEPTGNLLKEVEVYRRYAAAAGQRDRVVQALSGYYPDNSKVRFHLDYSEGSEAAKPFVDEDEVALEDMQKLKIVRVHERLKTDPKQSDPEAAAAVENALDDVRRHGTFSAGDRTDFSYRFFTSPLRDTAAVEARAKEMEERFKLTPPLQRFFRAMETPDNPENAVDGAGTQADLRDCYASYWALAKLSESFPRHEASGLAGVTPEILSSVRDDLVKRAESYRAFLLAEADRVQKADEESLPVGLGVSGDSAYVSDRAVALRREADEVEGTAKRLSALDTSDAPGAFRSLKAFTDDARSLEAKHLKGLLGRMVEQLSSLPDSDPRDAAALETVRKNLEAVEGNSLTAEGRIAAYRIVQNQIGVLANVRVASARAAQYEAYLDEEHRANTPGRWILKAASLVTDVDQPDKPTIGEEKLRIVIGRYKALSERLRSEDLSVRAAATQDLLRLERASLRKKLDENMEAAQVANFAIGVSIVAASAFTAGIATEAAAPFLVGRFGGALALRTIQAAAFAGSERAFNLPFSRESLGETWGKIREKPWSSAGGFAVETAITALMFKYIEIAMARFGRYFDMGLEAVARLRGVPADTLRESFVSRATERLSGTAYETLKFQQFQYYVTAGRLAAKGDPNFEKKAFREAFSGRSLWEGLKFLVGIKLFNGVAMPALNPALEGVGNAARGLAVSRELKKLEAQEKTLKDRFERFLGEGEGDPAAIESDIRSFLISKRDFLRAIPAERLSATARTKVEEARTETEGLIEAYEGFGSLARHLDAIHADKSLGIAWGEPGSDVHTYAGDGAALERALQHPGVTTISLTDPLTGKPVLFGEARLPMGITRSFTFEPAERPLLPQ
ncbi:MAG TPA: hypothetical protein VLJ37_09200 [bacterium]|nr:hypothetical protein [bacterium]